MADASKKLIQRDGARPQSSAQGTPDARRPSRAGLTTGLCLPTTPTGPAQRHCVPGVASIPAQSLNLSMYVHAVGTVLCCAGPIVYCATVHSLQTTMNGRMIE